MRRTACAGIVLLLILAAVAGCKTKPVGGPDESEIAIQEANEAAAERDKELAAMSADQTEKIIAMEARIAAIANAAATREFQPDFMQDIGVALGLVGQLSKEAGKHEVKNAPETVRRLRSAISSLVATSPAHRIQQHLERAEFSLTTGDLPGAGDQILAGAVAAYNPTSATIVPNVLSILEDASMAVSDADPAKAMELIAKARAKTMEDPSARDLLSAELTVLEAEESLRRQAWPILIAQTAEMATLLNAVKTRATPRVEPAEEEEPAASAEPEATDGSADTPADEEPTKADARTEGGDTDTAGTDDDEEADEPSE